jgi:hypothetical protein
MSKVHDKEGKRNYLQIRKEAIDIQHEIHASKAEQYLFESS